MNQETNDHRYYTVQSWFLWCLGRRKSGQPRPPLGRAICDLHTACSSRDDELDEVGRVPEAGRSSDTSLSERPSNVVSPSLWRTGRLLPPLQHLLAETQIAGLGQRSCGNRRDGNSRQSWRMRSELLTSVTSLLITSVLNSIIQKLANGKLQRNAKRKSRNWRKGILAQRIQSIGKIVIQETSFYHS